MDQLSLTNAQWQKIEPHFSGKQLASGRTRGDGRLFVEAVQWIACTGSPWRDLPKRYGHWKTTHRRYRRWCESGVILRIFQMLAADADNKYMMLDATIVRAHQHSAGAQKKMVKTKVFSPAV